MANTPLPVFPVCPEFRNFAPAAYPCMALAQDCSGSIKNSTMHHTETFPQRGRIEVICGSMFSGKTEELIRRIKRARIARQRVAIFKPDADVRYSASDVVSHDGCALVATPVSHSRQIPALAAEVDVVGIDEAQFFDDAIVDVCNALANLGKRVVVAGLDMDFRGVPFGPMPALCAVAEEVTKVQAICVRCGNLAYVSHRTVEGESRVMLGERQEYEPLCRQCYNRLLEDGGKITKG